MISTAQTVTLSNTGNALYNDPYILGVHGHGPDMKFVSLDSVGANDYVVILTDHTVCE